MTAPAVYLGQQPGFRDIAPIELYNLLVRIGEHPAGSTVSGEWLLHYGFTLPKRKRRLKRRGETKK